MGSTSLKYLLDSVIVIDHLNGIEQATGFIREHAGGCMLSAITRAEVLVGFDNRTEPLALELLDLFPTLPLTAETADRAARLRRARHLKLPDAFQAAAALTTGLILVTRNARDFQTGSEPEVLIPYRI